MIIDEKMRDEKLQKMNRNLINRNQKLTEKQQRTLALSYGKFNKYEYLTGKDILHSDQSRII